jgi:DNA-binding protein H-NS
MSIKLDQLSSRELSALITQASQRKKQLDQRKPAASVRKQILAIAKKSGYTLAELFGPGASRPAAGAVRAAMKKRGSNLAGKKVAPKYRNPANPSQTWAARGQQPKWLAAEIAKGRKPEEFAIK